MRPWRRWQDWTNLVLGLALAASPFVFGTSNDQLSTWNAILVGVAVVVVSLWALAMPASNLPEWTNLALGVWLFISPWVLGFTGVIAAAWTAWVLSVCIAGLALWVALTAPSAGQSNR